MNRDTECLHRESNTKSLNKTLAILSTFNEKTPMQRTSDIAAKLGINISTVSRHLNTLLDWGFLQRDDLTGCYYPGMKILELAGTALQNNDIYRYAFPELQKISYEHNVHSHMGIQEMEDIVHMISCSCESTKNLAIPMGHHQPVYCTAMGRAILAYLPPAKSQDILKKSDRRKLTEETKIEMEEINYELAVVRQKGYCLLKNELALNKASVAAPVFDRNRMPVAAISVSTTVHSLEKPERERELARAVLNTSARISGKLGYYPN